MIYLIIKSYLILFFFIVAGAITAFFGGLYLIFKPRKKSNTVNVKANSTTPAKNAKSKPFATNISSSDINAIAGDDVLATQLDLARAYIETGKAQLAKKILEYVLEKGSHTQQQEARDLLGYI